MSKPKICPPNLLRTKTELGPTAVPASLCAGAGREAVIRQRTAANRRVHRWFGARRKTAGIFMMARSLGEAVGWEVSPIDAIVGGDPQIVVIDLSKLTV